MCDCYNHKCCAVLCHNSIPMHIADFDYPREDFVVWCEDHLHLKTSNAVVFEWIYDEDDWGDPDKHERRICAIAGPEVGDRANHPNADFRILKEGEY